jgi:hypothetical protein
MPIRKMMKQQRRRYALASKTTRHAALPAQSARLISTAFSRNEPRRRKDVLQQRQGERVAFHIIRFHFPPACKSFENDTLFTSSIATATPACLVIQLTPAARRAILYVHSASNDAVVETHTKNIHTAILRTEHCRHLPAPEDACRRWPREPASAPPIFVASRCRH